MALVCFADETGTHDPTGQQPGSQVAGVAGYVTPVEVAPSLENQWSDVLRSFGVPAFHMPEFLARGCEADSPEWPYYKWDQQKKDAFIIALASIMRKGALPVGALVYVDDYHRILRPKIKAYYQHPYHLAFQLFLAIVDEVAGTIFPGENVAFIFDQQQQFAPEATRTFHQLQRYQDPNGRLGALTFESSRKQILLQAADLLASRLRKIEARARTGGKLITEGGWDDALLPEESRYVKYYGATELKNIQALCDAVKWYKPDGSRLTSF